MPATATVPSAQRVARHSPPRANEKIAIETRNSIAYHQQHPEQIPERLEALDREWDIERVLETNASTLMLTGLGMSLVFSRKYLLLPVAVAGFLLQHALQGWCPPVALFRRLGIRTQAEIEAERHALLAVISPGGGR